MIFKATFFRFIRLEARIYFPCCSETLSSSSFGNGISEDSEKAAGIISFTDRITNVCVLLQILARMSS